MRNKKLWNMCIAALCLQCALSPVVNVSAEPMEAGNEIQEAEEYEMETEETPEVGTMTKMEELLLAAEPPVVEESSIPEELPIGEAPPIPEEFPIVEERPEVEKPPEAEEASAAEPPQVVEEVIETEPPQAVEEVIEAEPPQVVEKVIETEPPQVPEKAIETEPPQVPEQPTVEEEPSMAEEPPQIEMLNVSSSVASTNAVVPEVSVTGGTITPEDLSITLKDSRGETIESKIQWSERDGKLTFRMDEIKKDGRYILIVQSKDAHGNQTSEQCTFTVNKHGSVFEHEHTLCETYHVRGYSPVIQVKNYDDVKIISCMVNGKEAEYSWDGEYIRICSSAMSHGKNLITLETKDGAGNISSMEPWEIMVEKREIDSTEGKVNALKKMNLSLYEKIAKLLLLFIRHQL